MRLLSSIIFHADGKRPALSLALSKICTAVVIGTLIFSVSACTMGQKSWSDLLTEGRTAIKSGDYAKAETSYQAAITAAQTKYGQNAGQTATCMTELADMYLAQQEYRKAAKIFKDLIPIYQKIEPGSPDLARVNAEYASVKKKIKHYKLEPDEVVDTKTEQGKTDLKTDGASTDATKTTTSTTTATTTTPATDSKDASKSESKDSKETTDSKTADSKDEKTSK